MLFKIYMFEKTSGFNIVFGCLPSNISRTIIAPFFCLSIIACSEYQPMCGVIIKFFIESSYFLVLFLGGSSMRTSKAAPANVSFSRASKMSFCCTTSPLEVLIK